MVDVAVEEAGQRLDNFLLRQVAGVPKTRIYRAIRKGEVRVNKGRAKPEYRVQAGDAVRIPPLSARESETPAKPSKGWEQRIRDAVLIDNADLLVINKPTGLAVHGGSGISSGLIELLRAANPQEHHLELVHRLDRSTSGCLLVARKRSSLRYLHEAFREGYIRKTYLTLLEGQMSGGIENVKLSLEVKNRQAGERHVVVSSRGKSAHTRFTPLSLYSEATYCKVDLFTGRTHQIRVHSAAIGHPVLGDQRYGNSKSDVARKLKLKRLFLHASVLEYPERNGKGTVMIQAPLGDELSATINRLDKR